MEENEPKEYTWSGLFAITAFSSVLFNVFIKLMDENFSYLFLKISVIAFFFAIANWVYRKLARKKYINKKKRRFAS